MVYALGVPAVAVPAAAAAAVVGGGGLQDGRPGIVRVTLASTLKKSEKATAFIA